MVQLIYDEILIQVVVVVAIVVTTIDDVCLLE